LYKSIIPALLLCVLSVFGCASATSSAKPATVAAENEKTPVETEKDTKMTRAGELYYMGLNAINHRNMKEAEDDLKQAAELSPESYNIRMTLAKVYEEKQDKLRAIEQYRAAIGIKKEIPSAYYGLTGLYIGMDLYKNALDVCEEALKNGVPDSAVATDMGWIYYLAGDLNKAEERLRAAKELDPKDTAPRHDLGLTLFELGKYEEALKNFQEVLEMNPQSILMPYYIALTYKKLGDEAKALDALREGLKKDPELPDKAEFYNLKYFPHTNPGDLTSYFEKLKAEKAETEKAEKPEDAGKAEKTEK